MKVVVVGINHAGTKAVQTLRKVDPSVQVVCYDQNDNISFLGCGIALWIQGMIKNSKMLFYASKAKLEKMGAEIHDMTRVEKIDNKKKIVHLRDLRTDKTYTDTYDKLVVGVGSWPIVPKWPNVDLKGIHLCKLYRQAESIIKDLDDPNVKNVVIIGAGYIGSELAEAAQIKGKKVTLLDALPRMLERYYDEPFTDWMQERFRSKGVTIATGEMVEGFRDDGNGRVKEVYSKDKTFAADLVVVCIGFKPNTTILKGVVDLDERGYVVTNAHLQTSDPNIYAIGDEMKIHDNAWGINRNISLATNAVRTGVVAALNVLDKNTFKFAGVQGSNAIHLFGLHFASTGMNVSAAKLQKRNYGVIDVVDNDKPEFMDIYHKVMFRLLYDKDTREIIGAQVASEANHTESIYFISLAIEKKLTVDELPFIDIFFLPHENKPVNYITLAGLKALGLEELATNFDGKN